MRWLKALALTMLAGWVALASAHARAGTVDVILEVHQSPPGNPGDITYNVVSMYDSTFFGSAIEEQYFTSLQAKLFGHIRVRLDPANLDNIQFVGEGSHLTLSTGESAMLLSVTEDSLAEPGGTPANMAGVSAANPEIKAALRGTRFEFVSSPMDLVLQDPLVPTLFRFNPQPIGGTVIAGDLHGQNLPFLGDGVFSLAGEDINNNHSLNQGFFEWAPAFDPSEDYVGGSFDFEYYVQPFGSFVTLKFSGFVTMEGRFSSENYGDVSLEGGELDLLGGATMGSGVTATFDDVTESGTFVAQRIGANGLPAGALEQAMLVPDLAYSLGQDEIALSIWNLQFGGTASAIEVSLGYSDILLPALFDESRLVLYHFHDGAWEQVAGQSLDTFADRVTFQGTEFSPFMLAIAVPEPSSLVLAATGLVAVVVVGNRRRQSRTS